MLIFERLANIKYKFCNRPFWTTGYCVSTLGWNEATRAKYAREQEEHDQVIDKVGVKKLEAPFKGLAKESMKA